MNGVNEPTTVICEVCDGSVAVDSLSGCEDCGRMFGPCCNNAIDSNYCVECDPPEDD